MKTIPFTLLLAILVLGGCKSDDAAADAGAAATTPAVTSGAPRPKMDRRDNLNIDPMTSASPGGGGSDSIK